MSEAVLPSIAFRAALSRKLLRSDKFWIILNAMRRAGCSDPESRTLALLALVDRIFEARDRRKAQRETEQLLKEPA
jgi:hypothetical protein